MKVSVAERADRSVMEAPVTDLSYSGLPPGSRSKIEPPTPTPQFRRPCLKVYRKMRAPVESADEERLPTSKSGPTLTGSTTVTETPRDNWRVSWRTAVLLSLCTLVELVAFGYKYDRRSDLIAPNLKFFSGGACPQTPPHIISSTFRRHWLQIACWMSTIE